MTWEELVDLLCHFEARILLCKTNPFVCLHLGSTLILKVIKSLSLSFSCIYLDSPFFLHYHALLPTYTSYFRKIFWFLNFIFDIIYFKIIFYFKLYNLNIIFYILDYIIFIFWVIQFIIYFFYVLDCIT